MQVYEKSKLTYIIRNYAYFRKNLYLYEFMIFLLIVSGHQCSIQVRFIVAIKCSLFYPNHTCRRTSTRAKGRPLQWLSSRSKVTVASSLLPCTAISGYVDTNSSHLIKARYRNCMIYSAYTSAARSAVRICIVEMNDHAPRRCTTQPEDQQLMSLYFGGSIQCGLRDVGQINDLNGRTLQTWSNNRCSNERTSAAIIWQLPRPLIEEI